MVDLFWQVYFFAMVLVFALFPFACGDSYLGWKSIWRVTYKDVAWTLLMGSIPVVNVILAIVLAMGLTWTLGWTTIFSKNWWNKPIFNRRIQVSK